MMLPQSVQKSPIGPRESQIKVHVSFLERSKLPVPGQWCMEKKMWTEQGIKPVVTPWLNVEEDLVEGVPA